MKYKISDIAKGTATFLRYQDGALWYRVTFEVTWGQYDTFDFPIPVDIPQLYEGVSFWVDQLAERGGSRSSETPLGEVVVGLQSLVEQARQLGASGGEFLATDKALRFLRWIRRHMEMIEKAQIE